MDAGGVPESVLSDDGFVVLHWESEYAADHAAGVTDFLAIDSYLDTVMVGSGYQCHDDFF